MSNSCVMERYFKLGFLLTPVCSYNHSGMSVEHINKCDDSGKAAILRGWKSTIIDNIQAINSCIKKWPEMNYGLLLGRISGFIAVDIDGPFGEKMFYEHANVSRYNTWEFTTSKHGKRLIFRLPSKLQSELNIVDYFDEKNGSGFTLLGDNNKTVIPPSRHRSGHVYKWVNEPWDLECMLAPEWILNSMTNSVIVRTYDGLDSL